jgi:hypothetical protein
LFKDFPAAAANIAVLFCREPVSKRFSSLKIKAGDHFNRRRSSATSRIEM